VRNSSLMRGLRRYPLIGRWVILLTALAVILNFADASTTLWGLRGGAVELNPLGLNLIPKALASMMLILSTWSILWATLRERQFGWLYLYAFILFCLNLFYVAVVANNIFVLVQTFLKVQL
jgi:hypothetical protein